jgi:imidazolonepropionase-like amidohydrolase
MSKSRYSVYVVILFFLAAGLVHSDEIILIKNGTIVPVVGDIIAGGSLLIKDGKIAEIGKNIETPAAAKVIDATGKFVYPGFVAPMTAIGVTGYPGAGNDTDETGMSTPHMDPYDAINPEDDCIDVTRIEGVTTVMTISGSRSIINGKSVVMNLEGDFPEDMVIKRYNAQIFNIGARQSNKYPSTLPGVNAFIRDKLEQAKVYGDKRKKSGGKSEGKEKTEIPSKRNLEMEALVQVVEGMVPALFITNSEATIRSAIRIIKEFKLKGIIRASSVITKFADVLAAEKIPVIWAGTSAVPNRWEPYDLNYHTASVLADKGVFFAFDPGGWGPGNRNVRTLPVSASISVAYGLGEVEAIKAITINPAKILGVDDQVGSLEAGKTANVVVWNENPLQARARAHTVIINGKIIPLTSVQTRLRDKFEKMVKERMKK